MKPINSDEQTIVRAIIVEESTFIRTILEEGENDSICDRCFDVYRPIVGIVFFHLTSPNPLNRLAGSAWALCSTCLCLLKVSGSQFM